MCVAAYVLFELDDNYRLWALIRYLIRDIRSVDLVLVLGSIKNSDELRCLLEVIKSTNFRSWI